MANILLLRESLRNSPEQFLLEHQATIAITRSVLGARIREQGTESRMAGDVGTMKLSEHKLFVPAHLDLMPLLALVMDDYLEFQQPESGESVREMPIVLYRTPSEFTQEEEEMIAAYSASGWFANPGKDIILGDLLQRYNIDATVVIGSPGPNARSLALKSQSRRMIGFSALLEAGDRQPLENMQLADLLFDRQMRDNLEKFNLSASSTERLGFWAGQYGEESLPQLERFVPFGPAFEMLMWGDDTE